MNLIASKKAKMSMIFCTAKRISSAKNPNKKTHINYWINMQIDYISKTYN